MKRWCGWGWLWECFKGVSAFIFWRGCREVYFLFLELFKGLRLIKKVTKRKKRA